VVGFGRGRPDLIKLLLEQVESWVTERSDPYGRMLVSSGTFYWGAALIMASHPAATPRSGDHRVTLR
jgi:hypothetical protein